MNKYKLIAITNVVVGFLSTMLSLMYIIVAIVVVPKLTSIYSDFNLINVSKPSSILVYSPIFTFFFIGLINLIIGFNFLLHNKQLKKIKNHNVGLLLAIISLILIFIGPIVLNYLILTPIYNATSQL